METTKLTALKSSKSLSSLSACAFITRSAKDRLGPVCSNLQFRHVDKILGGSYESIYTNRHVVVMVMHDLLTPAESMCIHHIWRVVGAWHGWGHLGHALLRG